ncbi:unnamed protein product [Thelazia callipaeda]|uniref:NifU_N domain-containing protein n=1 Tax=Thelazia callipaeda TaxID=103827 RepID=A0A0N5D711_THECL|nr:unnamed protein product [Thelazia callipaeda]
MLVAIDRKARLDCGHSAGCSISLHILEGIEEKTGVQCVLCDVVACQSSTFAGVSIGWLLVSVVITVEVKSLKLAASYTHAWAYGADADDLKYSINDEEIGTFPMLARVAVLLGSRLRITAT